MSDELLLLRVRGERPRPFVKNRACWIESRSKRRYQLTLPTRDLYLLGTRVDDSRIILSGGEKSTRSDRRYLRVGRIYEEGCTGRGGQLQVRSGGER